MKSSTAALKAAQAAIESIGLGYDLTVDLRLKYCKSTSLSDPRLIAVDDDQLRDIAVPGGFCIPQVPKSIKFDKGERMRFGSDVFSFQQVEKVLPFSFEILGFPGITVFFFS